MDTTTSKPQHVAVPGRPAPPRRRRARPALAALAAVAAAAVPGATRATAQVAAAPAGPSITEVGRLPVLSGSGPGALTPTQVAQSGWLVLDRTARRAYQVFETSGTTVIQSFDLDSLAPRRRAVLAGSPVLAGTRATNAPGVSSGAAGEVVHAVDEGAGRLYLPLYDETTVERLAGSTAGAQVAGFSSSPDSQRPPYRMVAIDEEAFDDGGRKDFAASFPVAGWPFTWIRSLEVDRAHGTAPGLDAQGKERDFGRLAAVTTLPNAGNAPPGTHRLVQWDVSDLAFSAEGDDSLTQPTPAPDAVPPVPLSLCAGSSMTAGNGRFEWGMLLAAEGLYLGCQTEANSSRAVFVGLDGAGLVTGVQQAYPLSRTVADVLVDRGGGRLLFRALSGGQTWWVFDTATRRFAGAAAAVLSDSVPFAAGVDEATGRLYMLAPDYGALDANTGREVPVRGGLSTTDTRLDPVPAAENVVPELAYPVFARILVDEKTRRIFVRRGHYAASVRIVYPGLQPETPSPVEPFYRVLRDDKPVPEAVAEGAEDDRRYTTNTAEADGVTKASYQASGSGYGARTLLIGGLAAATHRGVAGGADTGCDRDDRELLAAQVESATLSDVAASATAASLAADSRTEEQAGELLARCRPSRMPEAPHDPRDPEPDPDKKRRVDTTEVAFDGDGEEGSDFRTQCTGEEDPEVRRPPDGSLPGSRAGFSADVGCDQSGQAVAAASKAGAVAAVPGRAVTVGYSHSEVSVRRRPGGGVEVRVDSVARDVVVEGIGRIGVVRAEAVSEAAGRDGTARGTFTRTVCGVELDVVRNVPPGCLSERDQEALAASFNDAFTGQAELRLRRPEPTLLAGSVSGYRAGVQRRGVDLFQDRFVTRDTSLAVPGLELVLYRGDDQVEGAGRQILQLAGAQAGTSYGIACLYGAGPRGGCAAQGDTPTTPAEHGPPTVGPDGTLSYGAPVDGGAAARGNGGDGGVLGAITRLLKLPFRLAADVLRLLFSNPREFGLMAAVWALLYLPCYLGERRRTLQGLAARRLGAGA